MCPEPVSPPRLDSTRLDSIRPAGRWLWLQLIQRKSPIIGPFSLELPPRILKEPQTIVVNRKVKVVSTSGTKALSLRA
jgi:hypothetical protein